MGRLGAGVVAMVVVLGGARPEADERPQLSISIRNYAQVAQTQIDAARAVVAGIYAAAGVDVVWVSDRATVTLVVLPRTGEGPLRRFPGAMGFTPANLTQGGLFAYVVSHRVEQVARMHAVEDTAVLGASFAHELGHLLLPPKPHTSSGLMRNTWDRSDLQKAERGQLLFTPAQAEQIRAVTARRSANIAVNGNDALELRLGTRELP